MRTHHVHMIRAALIAVLVLGAAGAFGVVSAQGPVDETTLTADDLAAAAEFGRSVAIDANLAAVGAGSDTAGTVEGAGAVYLYRRQGQSYLLEEKLVAPDATVLLRRHKKMMMHKAKGRLMNIMFPRIPLWDLDWFLKFFMPMI